ncbi:MAG: hydrogenase 4 subunit B [Acidobacteria bacterium]|nr:hydrogenase 4 subunit B [Acidobacteriota bacterium]
MGLYLAALGLCAVAAAAGALLPRRRRVTPTALLGALGCLAALTAALRILVTGDAVTFHTAQVLPLTGLSLSLDPLGAWFVLTSAFVGVAACVYLVGYAREGLASRTAMAMFMVFLLTLVAVPAASSVMSFMFFWELMALSSLLLILADQSRHPEARSAAIWYGVMTHLGAASILLGFLVVAAGGGQSFSDLSAQSSAMSPLARGIAFLLILLGFASKAGAVPLHVWLPKAHPAAPSPVSALMSSAMVAMGVYGIIRVGRDLLHGGSVWWWVVVSLLGVASALYGGLHATTSTDVKRLLAYSTIDVVGLVLIGVGAAGALGDSGLGSVAHVAMMGALLLVLAHAGFKGALFLAAGAVERATGTRDLDLLGGLIHSMPVTTLVVVVGAGSIMAVPTLSGFSSEWLLLQGLLHGFGAASTPTVIVVLLGVVALALTGGLTAVAFVKLVGIGFLGRARSPGAAKASEVSMSMRVAMIWLTGAGVVIGLVPGLLVAALDRAAATGRARDAATGLAHGTGLVLTGLHGAIAPAALLGGLVVVMVLVGVLNQRATQRRVRRVEAWGCGRDEQTPRMQYTATSFAEPLQRVFADVLRPQADIEVTHVAESRYYEQSLAYENRVVDVVEARGYRPIIDGVLRVGRGARRLQNGSIHRYLALGFLALLVVLVVA